MRTHSRVSSIAFALGFGLVSFVFLNIALASLGFLLHISITALYAPIALAASVGLVLFLTKDNKLWQRLLYAGLLIATIIASVFAASIPKAMDLTFDADYYHKITIGTMKNGWNPIYQKVEEFAQQSPDDYFIAETYSYILETEGNPGSKIWVDHYPKAAEIFAANIYKVTGNIDSGKALTYIAIAALFCVALSLLLRVVSRNMAWLLAALAAVNPIIIAQLFSYYIDGIMGNILMILILALTLLLVEKQRLRWPVYALIVMTIVLAINIKFTGLLYAGIIALCYWAFLAFKKDWAKLGRLTIAGVVGLLIGVLLIGSNSYIKNQITNHHPLYPIYGQDSFDVETGQQPKSYLDKNRVHKFIESNLNPTSNLGGATTIDAPIKLPFSIDMKELNVYGVTDARQAGYGVWFGGILIVSTIAGIFLLIKNYRRYRHQFPAFVLPVVSLGLLVLAISMPWWARYMPHLYLFPLLVVVGLLITKVRIVPYVLLFMLLFNAALYLLLSMNIHISTNTPIANNFANNLQDCAPNKTVKLYMKDKNLGGRLYNVTDTCSSKIIFATQDEYDQAAADGGVLPLTDALVVIK